MYWPGCLFEILRKKITEVQLGCSLVILLFDIFLVITLIANIQNISNLIGRKEYNINGIVLLDLNIVLFDKKQQHVLWQEKNRKLLI